jgi:hypothetical protein
MRRVGAATTRTPRAVTPAIRAELGLAMRAPSPYPWAFAAVVVGVACVPLGLASMWTACACAVAVGFLILPFFRWIEQRDGAWREEVYRYGIETNGRVLDVEPPGSARADHLVRIEFRAGTDVIRTAILGCPLVSRGLGPDEEIVILFAADCPTRCLVIGKLFRPVVDAEFDE